MKSILVCLSVLVLAVIMISSVVFVVSEEPISPTAKEIKPNSPPELPESQVITMSPTETERLFYKNGVVEKMEIDGIIANPYMPLEFIACADGGKDYESLVILKIKPWNIHLGLILAGLKEGKGPKSFGDPTKPTGDLVLAYISWIKDGKTFSYRVEDLVINPQTTKTLDLMGWSFTGSDFVDDIDYDTGKPNGKTIYLADIYKNIIATWHDPAAILNMPVQSRSYYPNKAILPERGTKIVLTLRVPNAQELEELKKVIALADEREEKDRKQKEPAQPEKK